MYVLQSNVHGAHGYAQLFEAREEIEQVVWCQSELCRFDRLRGECEGGQRERCCPYARGRGCGRACGPRRGGGGGCDALAIFRGLPLQLQSIGERFFVCSHKVGQVLGDG